MVQAETAVVARARGPVDPAAAWEHPQWEGAAILSIDRHMGEEPSHKPRVNVKLLFDDRFLHVAFRVEDRWVRSVQTACQAPVCTDSCVEFFLTPGQDISKGYFNIEVNCGGTVLMARQTARGVDRVMVSAADAAELTVFHTMPAVVDPEIADPVTWRIGYRIPYAVLARYALVETPAPGVTWRANLYKCGDRTSHPHWLTWSPVDSPRPDFHRPESFGFLRFGS